MFANLDERPDCGRSPSPLPKLTAAEEGKKARRMFRGGAAN